MLRNRQAMLRNRQAMLRNRQAMLRSLAALWRAVAPGLYYSTSCMRGARDYGYLAGVGAPDGVPLDVWGRLPTRTVTAIVCTVDRAKRDTEYKLLLGCTPAEMHLVLATHNIGLQAAWLVERPLSAPSESEGDAP